MKINLAQKSPTGAVPQAVEMDKVQYPTVYIREVKGFDGAVGDKVNIIGRIKSVTKRDDDDDSNYDCEVECHEMGDPGKGNSGNQGNQGNQGNKGGNNKGNNGNHYGQLKNKAKTNEMAVDEGLKQSHEKMSEKTKGKK